MEGFAVFFYFCKFSDESTDVLLPFSACSGEITPKAEKPSRGLFAYADGQIHAIPYTGWSLTQQ